MATVVIMPKAGQSVESCILTEFKKKKGDTVAVGDILFSYETDKASFEEEATVGGTVLATLYDDGDEIPVLTNVMVIGSAGENIDQLLGGAVQTSAPVEAVEIVAQVVATPVEVVATVEGGSPVSPRARKLADKTGVNTASMVGTGPGGRIIERDVQSVAQTSPKLTPLAKTVAAQSGVATPAQGSGLDGMVRASDLGSSQTAVVKAVVPADGADSVVKPLTNMRKLIAKAMHSSLQNSAQLTHHLGADARAMLAMRKKVKTAMKEGYEHDITLNDMVCYAVIKALLKYPQVNAHFLGDSVRMFAPVHLGLAVDTERGLMVPVIRSASDMSIQGLSRNFKTVANACKKGSIDPDLLSSEAATFTVSNLGNYGVEMFTPVINLPQAAILGVNTIVPRPKDLGDGVYAFVPYIGLSLTYDHRALDGGEATRFLKQIAVEIENIQFDL